VVWPKTDDALNITMATTCVVRITSSPPVERCDFESSSLPKMSLSPCPEQPSLRAFSKQEVGNGRYGRWQQRHKVLPSDGARFDSFGGSVALGDGFALIGARHDRHGGDLCGAAYLFRVVPDPRTPLLLTLAVVGLICVGRHEFAGRSAN
jgi:hypothetical protein